MSKNFRVGVLLGGVALMLSACGGAKKPEGQVVATINGEEVTLQEVNAELQGVQLPENMDPKEKARIALQRVIDRKLFAAQARQLELDKTPDYVAQQRKLEETLLAQQLVKQQAAAIAQPSAAQLASFKSENPNIFARREQLVVDQIRFAPPQDMNQLKGLEALHTQDAVADWLQGQKIEFQRGRSAIDTAVLPPDVVTKINGLPAGEPFVLPARGIMTINTIVARQPAPLPEAQANQVAANAWREKTFSTNVSSRLDQLKKAAKIEYQAGYAPAAAPKPGAPAAQPAPAPAP